MLNIYLLMTGIALLTEAAAIKKGIDKAKEEGYYLNNKSGMEKLKKQLSYLVFGLPFIPIINIAIPFAIIMDYKTTYKNIVKELRDNDYIRKDEVVVAKPTEKEKTETKNNNNKSYEELSTHEKISYFEQIREEILRENEVNSKSDNKAKTYKKNK